MSTCTVTDCRADTNGFLCKPCTAELTRALADMQSLRHEVSVLATGQARVYRAGGQSDADREAQRAEAEQAAEWERERIARESRIAPPYRDRADRTALPSTRTMVNLEARDLLTAVDNLLVTWARVLHEATGTDWQLDTTEQVIVWLTAHVEAFRWHEAASDAHHDILDAHRRMQRAVDRTVSRVYAGPCDTTHDDGVCRRPLYAVTPPRFDNDLDRGLWWETHPIVCDGWRPLFDRSGDYRAGDKGCGAEHGRDDRRAWMLTEVEDRLLPLSLLQDALPGLMPEILWPHNRSTWWRWARRLEVKTVIDGVEFFRGGDVVDLCLREQQRIRGNVGKRQTRSA